MMKRRLNQTSGFTLIELIITIALAGIVMMMIMPYFLSGITTSHLPGQRLQDAMALQRVMENMNGAYGASSKDTAALLTLQYNITNSHNLFCNPAVFDYTVFKNEFISFNNNTGAELPPGSSQLILKVTIRSTTNPGFQLTQLFTVRVSH